MGIGDRLHHVSRPHPVVAGVGYRQGFTNLRTGWGTNYSSAPTTELKSKDLHKSISGGQDLIIFGSANSRD